MASPFASSGAWACIQACGNNSSRSVPGASNHLSEDVDTMLSKGIAKLSVKEREDAYNDLHGVSGVVEESPKFVHQKLAELDAELQTILDLFRGGSEAMTTTNTRQEAAAFCQAWIQDPGYVEGRGLRLMFLRATSFNVCKAAQRMLLFFREKLDLFGPSKLTKQRITMDDLSDDELACMETGVMQLLPIKDRAGRPIMFVHAALLSFKKLDDYLRVQFYMFMCMVQDDVENQRKGYVDIIYHLDKEKTDPSIILRGSKLRRHLPLRQVGCHICYYAPDGIPSFWGLTFQAASSIARTRVRFHTGSSLECRYVLMGFGIPTFALPLHPSGEARLDRHQSWLKQRKEIEEAAAAMKRSNTENDDSAAEPLNANTTERSQDQDGQSWDSPGDSSLSFHPPIPKPNDVLLGRGIPLMKHPGNVYYRQLVASHSQTYDRGSKLDKTVIAELIAKRIKEAGGRFLKQIVISDTGGANNLNKTEVASFQWEEIDSHAARLKIASAFRFHRKQRRKQAQNG